MKKRKTSRGFGARRRFLQDPFFRACQHGLEQLEERRLLSATPLTTDHQVTSAWFSAVADPAQTTQLGQVFLDSVDAADETTNRVNQSRWIVQLTSDALATYPTPAATAELFAGTELEVLTGLGLPGQLLVGAHCTTTGQAIEFFANHPEISYFEADSVHVASITPNDPRFDQQFGLHNTGQGGGITDADIDAPEAWEITTGSRDVVVAVVDTGIAYTHPDLAANIWTNPGEIAGNGTDDDNNGFIDDIHGWDFRNNDADPMDDHRHGTHVAGIIGAVGNNNLGIAGVAWKTSLMALKFLDSNNAGYTSDSVRAINYATMMRTDHDINVRVINNSYTGERSTALEETIAATAAADILLVTAAGNGNALGLGYDIDTDPVYPASIPATNSIVVGASGQFDELARFSNYGQNTVDLLAPGVGIVSTVPPAMGSYASLTGTSMAAPMVSATAALIASNLPDITVAELQAAILGTVDTADELTGKVKTGGRLNTAAALAIDTYRPRVTLISSNTVSSFGSDSYPLQVTVRDNVGINLDSLDNDDLQLIDSDGRALDTVISKETVTGSSTTEKTVTYHANAPTGGWDSSFNDTYDLVAVAGQYADTNGNTNLQTTLGQFEVEISLAGPMDVNSTEDLVDNNLADDISGAGDDKSTLRSAIMQANATAGLDTIQIPAGIYNLTIAGQDEDSAATGDLDINEDVILIGAGVTETIIDAKGLDRVFDVASDAKLTLRNLTVTGGSAQLGGGIYGRGDVVLENVRVQGNASMGDGGGVYAKKKLDVTNSSITGNTATSGGGGIRGASGSNVTLLDSLLANNTAGTSGGAIFTSTGVVEATNVTFSGNQAATGGAIEALSFGAVTLTHVTVANNRATNQGGGLRNVDGEITVRNTIVATNLSTGGHANVDIDGEFSSEGNNIVGVASTATGFTNGTKNDIVGSSSSPADPGLTPLGDYGGPTHVHSLVEGSPAIDAANDFYSLDHDQRGIASPQNGDASGSSLPDIGAMEFILYGQIHGIKYHDRNSNGQQDDDEEGLAGWTMEATRTDIPGQAVATAITDNMGSYALVDLVPGDYAVSEIPTEGWQQTEPAPPPPQYVVDPSITVTDIIGQEGDEGTTAFTFTASLSWAVDEEVSVDYTIQDVTTAPAEIPVRSGTLTIPAGTTTAALSIGLVSDTVPERIESFQISLSNPAGAVIATPEATGYVIDDDATFTVNSTIDSSDANPGDGLAQDSQGRTTLRSAIMEANALAGDQSIELPAGTYQLTRAGQAEDLGATGDLDLTDSTGTLTIVGAGGGQTTIDAAGLDRVFDLQGGAKLELANLTISGGIAAPGEAGGGLRSRDADLYLYQVTVDGNQATAEGGGLAATNNTMLSIFDARFTQNQATLGGGGIYIDDSSSAMVSTVQVDNNTSAEADGGGLLSTGSVAILDSSFHDNSANNGGGAFLSHEATVDHVLFHDNQTTATGNGGALYISGDSDDNGQFHVANSTIYDNFSYNDGGGVVVTGIAKIVNSTISDNFAMQHGGGIVTETSTVNLTLLSNTITNNRVGATGGGVSNRSGTISIGNTIVSGNHALTDGDDLSGSFTTLGHNLVGSVGAATGFGREDECYACSGPTTTFSEDLLGTTGLPIDALLVDNGDTFPIYVPSHNSLAVDAGDNELLSQVDTNRGPRLAQIRSAFLSHVISDTADGADSVSAADMDGDGDMDVVSASSADDKIAWYENDGSENFTTHTISTADDAPRFAHPIDFDGDGDIDVLALYTSTIAWYENNGSQQFTRRPIDSRTGGFRSVYSIDMDNDGDTDVLSVLFTSPSGTDDDGVYWYENDGSESFEKHKVYTGQNIYTVHALDLDDDGDIDILSGDAWGYATIAWHENNGAQYFTPRTITVDATGSAYATDLDSDGDMDILSKNGLTIAWHANDGNELFTEHTINIAEAAIEQLLAKDIDGDGDMDIISATGWDDTIAWYENDGNENFTYLRVSTTTDGANDVDAADVDGDGDIDILSSSIYDDMIKWYENTAVVDIGAVERTYPLPPTNSQVYTIAPAEVVTGSNFGGVLLPGRISGWHFLDANSDGQRDINEFGIPDWTMYLDRNNNAALDEGELSTATDALGHFEFENVPPLQEHHLLAKTQNNWQQTGIHLKPFPFELAKLTADDGAVSDTFGFSVSISGNTAIVSAHADDDNGTSSGSAYIFENLDGIWTEVTKLTASDAQAKDVFGYWVSISGDTAIVGAQGDDDNGDYSGSAYVFQTVDGTWTEVTKLTAHDGENGDRFGNSVSISGDTAIVGSQFDGDNGYRSGSAYVFEKTDGGWTEVAKVTAHDGAPYDRFGWSTSISGDTIFIGSLLRGDANGCAYVFERLNGTWIEVAKLTASDGELGDFFGWALSVSDNVAIVGAEYDDDNGDKSGSAYVFENLDGTWTEVAKIKPSDGEAGHYFGRSVSISNNMAIVGARKSDDNGESSGSAYIFKNQDGAWTQTAKLTASDAAADDLFGNQVSISGDTAIVSATGNDDKGSNSGSAYIIGRETGTELFNLDPGQSISGITFGSKYLPASLSGQLFRDLDMDGINDPSEGGLEGWTVYLDADSSGTPSSGDPQTTTDSVGHYSFSDLEPFQSYTIAQVKKSGYLQTGPKALSGAPNTLVTVHANSPQFQNLSDLVGTGTGEFYFTGLDSSGRGFNSQELFHYEPDSDSVTLLTTINDPSGITTDGNQAYWIDHDQDGNPVILRRGRADATNEILYPRSESDTQLVDPVDLEVISSSDQGTELAVLDGNSGQLWKLVATPLANSVTAIGAARYTAGADRTHRSYLSLDENNAYVADPGLNGFADTTAGIESIPLAGGSWQSLYTGALAEEARGISVSGQAVYYSRGNEVYQLPTSGADPTLLVSDERFGYLGGLWFENDKLYAVDTINMAQAVSWEISFDSHYTPNANKGWTVTPEAGEQVNNLDFGDIDAASLGGASSDSRITGRVYKDINGNGQLDNNETGLAGITLYLDLNNNYQLDEGEPVSVTLEDDTQTTDENEAGLYAFSGLTAGFYSVTPVVPAPLKQIGPLETQFAVSSVAVADGPRTTASGDFNGDGLSDLVVGSGNSDNIAVLLNLDNGSFAAPVSYTTGVGPSDIAVADVDADGQLDLLVTNLYSSSVSILKGKEDGTFDPAQSLVTGYMPTGVKLADVNQDTYLDIVVTNEHPDSVSVLRGKADGSFEAKTDFPAGDAPQGLVLLDYDSDNDLDMAIPNLLANTITLLTNNGSGSYSIASQPAVGSGPFSISAGDINGDGGADLVVANVLGDDISILFANGSGGFDPAISVGAGQGPTGTSLVDVDEDGDLDIAVSNSNSTNLSILVNQGNGTFQTPVSYGVGRFFNSLPFDVITDDFSGDGKPDFVVTNSNDNQLTILTNRLGPGPAIVEVDGDGNKSNVDIQLNETLPPTLGLLADLEVIQNSGAVAVSLRNITAGLSENQPLAVTASIADSTLVSVLTVDYSNPANSGTLNIQPATDKFGSSVVTVTVTDGGTDGNLVTTGDNMLTTGTFTYTVTELTNAIPTLETIANPAAIDEDAGQQTVNLTGITAGAAETQVLAVSASSNNTSLIPDPAVSYSSPAATGSLNYTPVGDASGSAVITVTITDGGDDNNLATAGDNLTTSQQFTVNVNAVNDAPTFDAISDPAAIDEDAGQQTVNLAGIGAGGGESQHLAVTASSNNTSLIPNPSVTYTSPAAIGSLNYTPVGDASGSAVITVTVTDGGDDNNLATAGDNLTTSRQFTVTVNAVNDTPTLATISNPAAIDEDAGQQTVNLTGITAGGGETQHVAVSASSNNTSLIPDPTVAYSSPAATGSLNYTPVGEASGSAVITVTVTDGGDDNNLETTGDNLTTSRQFTVTVNAVNDTPTLATISNPAAIDEDAGQQTVNLAGITAGGGETQHLAVSASSNNTGLVADPTVVYTSPQSTGSLKYQPNAGSAGTAIITVTLTDGGDDNNLSTTGDNLTNSQQFTITVSLANALPTLNSINTTTIDEDAPQQTVQLSGISAGADEDQPLAVTASSNNTALIPDPTVIYSSTDATGSLTFTPVPDANGSAVISVTVTDGGPDGNLQTTADNAIFTQTFTVNVTPVNDTPVAQDANFAPAENSTTTVDQQHGLIALGSDVDNDPLTFRIDNSPAYGQLTTQESGSFTYQLNQGFNRSDFFTYVVNDGTTDSNVARVDFHVEAQRAWYNSLKPLDVDDNGLVTAADVLRIIDTLNADGYRQLVNARVKPLTQPFYDVNADTYATALDALIVINELNKGEAEAEGESSINSWLADFHSDNSDPTSRRLRRSTTRPPARASLRPVVDDAYRTRGLAERATDQPWELRRRNSQEWSDAIDQLLEEDIDSFWEGLVP